MNSVRRAAKAIRDQDRETADRGVREVEYADVKRINPLVLEMQESSLVLDNDDLSLTAWVRAYDAEIGIAKGDTAVVKQMRHGVWLVSDVLTPSATPTFGGSGIYQPLDSDLTAIAALTTTAYGRSLLALADAAAGRTLLGLVIGTDVQAYDGDLAAIAGLTSAADKGIQFTGAGTAGTFDLTAAAKTVLDDATVGAMLTTMGGLSSVTAASTYQPLDSDLTAIAALTTTAYGRSVLALADAAAARTLFGLVIGTDVQGYDAELAAIAGLTSAADRLPYFTGAGTASLATFTAAGRALVDDADAAAQRTTLGLVIGTNVQAYDAELAAIAGLTSAADRLPYFTGLGTASLATFTAAGRALIDDADATAQRTTLGLGSLATASTINGGNWSGTDLAVVDGGTGASTAAAARANLGTDTHLATYKTILQGGFVAYGFTSLNTTRYGLTGGGASASIPNTATGPTLMYLEASDYAITGYTTKLRVKFQALTNATSPAITITIGLSLVSATAGAALQLNPTLNAPVAGSTVAQALVASTRYQGNSGDFTIPADGYYCLSVSASGTQAANSLISLSGQVQVRHV